LHYSAPASVPQSSPMEIDLLSRQFQKLCSPNLPVSSTSTQLGASQLLSFQHLMIF